MTASAPLTRQALGYMLILAVQFGVQPILTKRYITNTCNTSACRSSVVLVQEGMKFVIASSMLLASGQWKNAVSGWSIKTWIAVAGIPSALYCIQNLASLLAYQNLDPLTFNVLNQTKTLSAALCCFIIMGRKQSQVQLVSLFLLLLAALVIEGVITLDFLIPGGSSMDNGSIGSSMALASGRHLTHGVAPVLLASFLSGLAGALSQKNLQSASGCGKSGGRNSYLFSMELCVASMLILSASLLTSEDGYTMRKQGFFDQWSTQTIIPIFSNAMGGIVVGLVTKHAGSVRKGFALVFGIFLSGIIQGMMGEKQTITKEKVLGGTIAALSLLMHCTHPYIPPSSSDTLNGKVQNGRQPGPKRSEKKAKKED